MLYVWNPFSFIDFGNVSHHPSPPDAVILITSWLTPARTGPQTISVQPRTDQNNPKIHKELKHLSMSVRASSVISAVMLEQHSSFFIVTCNKNFSSLMCGLSPNLSHCCFLLPWLSNSWHNWQFLCADFAHYFGCIWIDSESHVLTWIWLKYSPASVLACVGLLSCDFTSACQFGLHILLSVHPHLMMHVSHIFPSFYPKWL